MTLRQFFQSAARWFDNQADAPDTENPHRVDWARIVPFVGMHLACVAVAFTGWSATALFVAAALYGVRMFAITGFYHRYFSHRAFRTTRGVQFLFAFLGATAAQRGPLWWASHHRHHHLHADDEEDAHSPHHHGFWWAHAVWFLSRRNFATREALIEDLSRYPELRFLDRFDWVAPLALALALYLLGTWLEVANPGLETTGMQLLVWGFFVSTVFLYHATFTVNSLAHSIGRRRYATRDRSRNNWWLAILTLGEGWHNNHHHYPGAARQGFFWWEIDITWYGLRLLATLGLVSDLRGVPTAMLHARSAMEEVTQ
jgi:stearoyl-CoA desaturase (Delta-9 desaturase)